MYDFGEAALPAAYRPTRRNPSFDELPLRVRHMLHRNADYSRYFTKMAGARQAWFDSHVFRPVVDCCMDERLLDVTLALGESDGSDSGVFIPPGIVEALRTPGGNTSLSSLSTCLLEYKRGRVHDHARKLELRLCLAHYSSSRPDSASCSYWGHDPKKALTASRNLASRLDFCRTSGRVAVHGIINTDCDSICLFGPSDSIDTLAFAAAAERSDAGLHQEIVDRLKAVFPRRWGPLARLDELEAGAFYLELGELLAQNVSFVMKNRKSRRRIQLFEHAGKMVYVGRHFEFVTQHNEGFLIDDHNPELEAGLVISLEYVGRNVITAAEASQGWSIPIHVNVPYTDDDLNLTWEYADGLRRSVIEIASKNEAYIEAFWLTDPHGVPARFRKALRRQLAGKKIASRLAVSVSISKRTDRLFRLE
jgi:hypothetical protein